MNNKIFNDECYCLMLRNITSLIKKIYNKNFQILEITNEQFTILEHIQYLGPISVTDLSKKIKIDRTTLSRNLKVLEKNKLIEDNNFNSRSRQIILSREGKTTIKKAEEIWEKIQKEIETTLGTEKLENIKETLKILENYFEK